MRNNSTLDDPVYRLRISYLQKILITAALEQRVDSCKHAEILVPHLNNILFEPEYTFTICEHQRAAMEAAALSFDGISWLKAKPLYESQNDFSFENREWELLKAHLPKLKPVPAFNRVCQ
jgi:hypothetical protein